MDVIIFIIILAVLIIVHELGHFIFAKKSGVKVTEFGLGYPPFLFGFKKGETLYSLNALPFGGFVKIFGEDPDEESTIGPEHHRSVIHKPRKIQALILAGGVMFNILFAWLLISVGFVSGLPTSTTYSGPGVVENPRLVVTAVSEGGPAVSAGVKAGDSIVEMTAGEGEYVLQELNPDAVSNFIEAHADEEIEIVHQRGDETITSVMRASESLVPGRKVIGISMDVIGTLQLPPHEALIEGGRTTFNLISAVTVGLFTFIKDAFSGSGDFSQVTGPVGIVGLVGDVSDLGWIYLLSFTAFISINLAVINLLPFPALDGGRLLFLLIEAIKGSRINPKVANTLNATGFILLVLLMVVVTIKDVMQLF